MIKRVARSMAEVVELPGRTWFSYIGPQNSPAKNVSVGVALFPAGSSPPGHVHPAEEETIYVISGRGRLVTPEATANLDPGVSVFIPVGTFHATEADGSEPLELVCLFSPPVVPGSYERGDGG